jgi:hypothetical protein
MTLEPRKLFQQEFARLLDGGSKEDQPTSLGLVSALDHGTIIRRVTLFWHDSFVLPILERDPLMSDQTEIDWHREQIAKNRLLIEEIERGNTAGSDVFPETQAEIGRLNAQIEQSELIVAAYEKEHPQD